MSRILVVLHYMLMFSLFWFSNVGADTQLSVDYILDAELHSEDDDELVSELSTSIVGSESTRKLNASYDLNIDFVYEHEQNEDNVLFEGVLDTTYGLTPYFSWLLDIELQEISIDGNNEFDRLETQTLIDVATGFRYTFDNLIRGRLSFTGLRNEFYYEDSVLDAREDQFLIRYSRPITGSSEISLSYSALEQRYDDESQSINDVDNNRIRIDYSKSTSFYEFNIYLSQNNIDFVNQSQIDEEDVNGNGISITYFINSISTLYFIYASEVQQVFQINTTLVDNQNPLLDAGLVEIVSTAILYEYEKDDDSLSVRIYENDIEDVSSGNITGEFSGLLASYDRTINRQWSFNMRHNQFENEVNNSDFEITAATINYLIHQSQKYSGTLGFTLESGSNNDRDIDDQILSYQFTAGLY